MTSRNLVNFTTFNPIVVTQLDIQSSGAGFSVYSDDPNDPLFSINTTTNTVSVFGDLFVGGSATFTTIDISEFDAGLQMLGAANPGNSWDLGVVAEYNDGTAKYTGIIKDASDSLQRWTFFKDITTPPTTVVTGIDASTVDSLRINGLYVNDGSAANPTMTFSGDLGYDTGLFLAGQNDIGISAGATKVMSIRYVSGTSTEVQLDSTTSLKLLKLNTIDDTLSENPAITTGHIYLRSGSGADKWLKFYSATEESPQTRAGAVFTSSTEHFFLCNTGGYFTLLHSTGVGSPTSVPDVRLSGTAVLFRASSTELELSGRLTVPFGAVANPAIRFSTETSTGIYRSGSNAIGFACAGVNVVDITSSSITFAQKILNNNGTLVAPSIAFTSNTDVGFFRDIALGRENITVSIDGTDSGKFTLNGSTPQFIMPLAGTASLPSFAFADITTGIYAPTDESTNGQIALTLGGLETIRFRRRTGTISQGLGNIEFYNSAVFTPDASTEVAAVYTADTRINNTFKAYNAWFQAYNLIDESLVFLYTFRNTGAIGLDYSNNGKNATVAGTPTINQTVVDTNSVIKRDVLDLTSNPTSASYLNLTSHLSSFTSLDNVSISFWFKISGTLSTDNTIFNCYKTTGAKTISIKILSDANTYSNALQVTVESDSLTTLQYHTATSADTGTPSIISVKDNLWHHVVIQLGSGTGPVQKHNIYYDGVHLTVANSKIYYTSTGDNSGNPELSTNSFDDLTFNNVTIGALYDGSLSSLRYTGYLKDFYFTNRILKVSEIANLYTEPTLYAYKIDAAELNVSNVNFASNGLFSDGTAGSPSISFTNYSDMGFYVSAADTLGISTAGVERITIKNNLFQYASNSFEIDTNKAWMQLKMSQSGSFGPRIIFGHPSLTTPHSLRSLHATGTHVGNYLDFYLYAGSLDADSIGNTQIMRLGATGSGANSALVTTYGIHQSYNGSVSAPTYSFTNSPASGLYRIGSDDLGFATAGTLRFEIADVVTVGNASGDTTTKLYVPLGSLSLPSISFIGDTNTGIYSDTSDSFNLVAGGVQILNINSTSQISSKPTYVVTSDSNAFYVRNTALGTSTFTVDTTNSRVGLGYNSLYISRYDSATSTSDQRVLIDASSSLSGELGLLLLNSNSSGTNTTISSLNIGRTISLRNAGNISFYYVSSSNTDNKLQFGINGVSTDMINLKGDGTINVNGTLTASGLLSVVTQIRLGSGSVGSPSYAFIDDTNTGIYNPTADQLGLVTGGSVRFLQTSTYTEIYHPLRLSSGSTSSPALTFTSDTSQDSGLYYISNDRFGISNGNQNTWIFDKRGVAPHECLNELYLTPNGTNVRVYVQDAKFRASSNQNILNILPVLHYKFTSAPSSNTTIQDESINKYAIEATTATYITSTISLTDSAGVGLLQYGAAQFVTTGTDRIETSTVATELIYLSDYKIGLKFKLTSAVSGSLFEIYGNRDSSTSSNFIKVSITTGNIGISVHNGTSTILTADTTSIPLTTNIWYNLIITFSSTGNSTTLNGSSLTFTYTTGTSSTTITPSGFGSSANLTVVLGGVSSSALGYFAEFYIAPTLTTETASALYRVQAHEIYTNKLQLSTTTYGLVDEGYILRSDKGNNVIWDNSIQIKSGSVELGSSKVLRLADGTSLNPAISFINNTQTGLFYTTNSINFSINNSQVVSIGASTTQVANDLQLTSGFRRNVTVVSSATLSLDSTYNIVELSYAADASDVVVTLPEAISANKGREYVLIKTGNGGGNMIINTFDGNDFIDNGTNTQITVNEQYNKVTLICNGVNRWYIL